MKQGTFVVAIASVFESVVNQYKVYAICPFEALKQGMLLMCADDEVRKDELEYQNSDVYPKDLNEWEEQFHEHYFISVLRIS